jgi:ribonuclease HII
LARRREQPELRYDRQFADRPGLRLAGVDEAGRGSWAGPVVAAAVVLPAGWCPAGLDDSKRLSASVRERLFDEIRGRACCWSACAVSASVIDELNVLQATLAAMARCVCRLRPAPDLVLVDGCCGPPLAMPSRLVPGGDGLSGSIAAAAVMAKVLRDRIMTRWDRRYPGYGFASHKGYGCSEHRRALRRLGPSPLHRRSYRPVALLTQGLLWEDESP